MREGYGSVNAKCPFYLSESKKKRQIRCEGATKGSVITVRFVRDRFYEQHRTMYCCSLYKECPYYKLTLGNKYDSPETV